MDILRGMPDNSFDLAIVDPPYGIGASNCIACDDLGFEMTGIELDPYYYEAAKNRLVSYQMQHKLF